MASGSRSPIRAAVDFKAGKEGPIILIGHSLGADAVMEMAAYLGRKGIPVALVVPFDGTQSFAASDNVARVLNLTQRNYAYMRRGPGFHGTLANVDVSSDPNIDHINIDKSPRLHARVVSEVLAITGGHRLAAPSGPKPTPASAPAGQDGPRCLAPPRPAIASSLTRACCPTSRRADAGNSRQNRQWRRSRQSKPGRRRHARYRSSGARAARARTPRPQSRRPTNLLRPGGDARRASAELIFLSN